MNFAVTGHQRIMTYSTGQQQCT